MRTALFAAAALFAGLPATVAFAHEQTAGYALQEKLEHLRDHVAHDEAHREIDEAHEHAHEEGFSSQDEHEAYHRGLEHLHGEVHDELPGTWHSHYDGGYGYGYAAPRYYARSYSYGYQRYAPARYYYMHRRPIHHRGVIYYAPY